MKRYLILKDFKRRSLFSKLERKMVVFKYIVSNLNLNVEDRNKAFLKLSSLKKNSYSTRIKNRCMFTGRGPFTLRDFKVSRILFRQKASFGELCGIRKSSW